MKKRFMCLLLALIMCLSLLPGTPALADEEENGDFVINGTSLTKYTGPGGDVVIPDGITYIGERAFSGSNITSVVIPDSVTSTHFMSIFSNCKSLRSVVIGDGLTKIGKFMFADCTSLESVTLGKSVEVIDDCAFQGCTNLSDINAPSSLKRIESHAFDGCGSLTSFDISSDVYVDKYTFQNCDNLILKCVPESLKANPTFYMGAFNGGGHPINFTAHIGKYKGSERHVTIPYGATSFELTGCSNIVSVKIPDTITYISTSAFSGCTALTDIEFPDTITSIGKSAFSNCTSLKDIEIPDSVTSIGESAFSNCTGLTDIVIPDSVISADGGMFSGCTALKNVTLGTGLGEIGTFGSKYDRVYLDSLTFSKGTETIDIYISSNVKSVNIPVSVKEIKRLSAANPIEVNYAGTSEQWEKITKASDAFGRSKVTINYSDGGQAGENIYVYFETFETGYDKPTAPTLNWNVTKVTYGKPYGELPTVTVPENAWPVPGIAFAGWFTAPEGGTQVTESTIVTRMDSHHLYAHWRYPGDTDTPTVTFNANGGRVSPDTMTVTRGQPYGKLPTPTREGWTFDGWFTGPNSDMQITESTTVTASVDHTLYAHWSGGVEHDFLKSLSYSFSNNWSAFGYSYDFKIPYERYKLIFGDTALARQRYEKHGTWGGSCYGMSTTSSMFFQQGNGVNTTSFNANAELPSQLRVGDRNSSWNLTVKEFIEAMQISQQDGSIQNDYNKNKNQLSSLCQAVERVSSTGGEPVVVCMMSGHSGHAVVGYEIQTSGSGARLMIYDCNYPGKERYISLTKNSSGAYTGWSYDGYSSGNAGDWISYVPYSDYYKVWQNRAGAKENNMNLLSLSAANAEICDRNGNVVATVKNGELVTSRSDVYPMIYISDNADGKAAADADLSVWLPSDMYTVKSTGSGELEVSMVNVDQSVTVTTTAGAVTFAVSDEHDMNYVQLEGGGSYEIVLDSSLKNTYQDVRLSGKTDGSDLALAQISGKLYAEGVDLGKGAQLNVNGKKASEDMLSGNMPNVTALLSQKLPFTDVAKDAWYREAVQYVYAKGLMNGVSATQFGPGGTTSRGQIVTILYRLEGSPAVSASGFTDVPAGQWYSDAVSWASANGIVNGYGGGRFGPNDPITREQMASILYRYAAFKGYDVSARAQLGGYADEGDVSSYAKDSMAWANALGLISGVGGKTLAPTGTATRAQAAKILMSFCENVAKR